MVKKGISTDPIADMLTIIRNGYLVHKDEVLVPTSKVKKNIALILAAEKYIESVEEGDGKLVISLRYVGKNPAITEIKRISKPGLRVYVGSSKMRSYIRGLGILIISTSHGLMSSKTAIKQKLGGELVCRVW